jgi:hypothetical protein
MGFKLAQPPENVDRTLWLYELCRFLIQKVNIIIVALFEDSPPCSSTTCPEMRASEWQYLCAVHDPPKSCCAIDYCCHTLDWAANTLTSPKHFPSRLALGTDQSTQHSQSRQLTNIFRRVYRIFAHAWFSHREMFWKVEGRTGLYIFYKTVCEYYDLVQEENYTIPAEAEGIDAPPDSGSLISPLILKREPSGPASYEDDNSTVLEGVSDHTLSTAGTTKRHRNSPSVGAMSVSTVVEENEEEEERPTLLRPDTKIFNSTPEAEEEVQEPATPIEEGEDGDDVEESVPTSFGISESAVEPEKQSASEEANADPVVQDAENHTEASTTEEEPVAEQHVSDVIPDAKDSDDESVEAEDTPSSSDEEATNADQAKPKEEAVSSTEKVVDNEPVEENKQRDDHGTSA